MIYENIDQIVSTTHHTVNKLLLYKNWPNALALYFRYIQQRKMQENNQTLSVDSFMIQAMWWSKDKFYKAKKILCDNWLIEVIKKNDKYGKITWWYIKVNFVIQSPTIQETQSLEKPESGKTETNTLVENINTLQFDFETIWTIFPHARKWKKDETKKYYKKLDSNSVLEEIKILNWKVRMWLQEQKYIPAIERWMRDFVKTNDIVKEQVLKAIVYAIMENKTEERPNLAKQFISDFWEELAEKYRKQWSKETNGITLKLWDNIYHS